jgi:predicted nucleotidyltransferase
METTKNELTARQKKFLSGLSNYLDTTFYYFGSIQRDDYVKGQSDIDIDIFTDNEESIMTKLSHYLRISKKSFRKIVWKLRNNNKVALGYKVKFENDFIIAEFSIYNEKIKKEIVRERDFDNKR